MDSDKLFPSHILRIDPKTAQGLLRHASSDITMDIYTHAQEDAKRKALEKYESRLVQ